MKRVISCLYLAFALISVSCQKESSNSNSQNPLDGLVFKDNVIIYNEDMDNNLQVVSDSLFLLSPSTPLDKIPQIGDIVFYHADETSKGMFIGKTLTINEDNGGWLVSTEIPSIDEVFESFSLDFSMDASNTVVEYDEDAEDRIEYCRIVDNSIWDSIETVYSEEDEGEEGTQSKAGSASEENRFPIEGVTLEFSPNTSSNLFKGKIYIRLDGSGVITNDNLMIDLRTRVGLSGSLGFAVEAPHSGQDFPILQIKKGITLYTNKLVGIRMKPSLVFTAAGEIRVEAGLNFEVLNSDFSIDSSSEDLLKKGQNHIKDNYFRVESLHSEGEFGLALKGNLYAFIFTENFLSSGVQMKAGVKIKGEKNVGIQFPDFANFDFSVCATPFLGLTPFVSSNVTGKLHKKEGPTFNAEVSTFHMLLLPNIHEINYEKKDKEHLEATASVSGQNSSFVKSKDEGLALFKKGDKVPIAHGSLRTGATKSSFDNLSFDISEGEKYEIAPYIESKVDGYVYGERISITNGSIVGTWKCIAYYWDSGVDYESDHVYIFNEDETGAFTDSDSYLNPTKDELIEYKYDYDTSTLMWRYMYYMYPVEQWWTQKLELEGDKFTIHIHDDGYGHEWWIFERI